ncbi:MFS transporter [Serratia odorifera]|jgi:MFS transporter, MHS family, proline/betaine transporter|uniref:Transporter, major facilitator family protein n=2 Tax=Serratia odorifera TaxID=618 RepID=D4E774_SEROD|nr:MFS transporter [Serratia odorifera]EFE94450.1 transporter, major facilitator family protein [Serratia odorifera DSM 4582]PNK89186.1 MFS transporter [Serratia odorifera]RII70262.1 MFS transporter [Serratia odorifera]VDZ63972.1 Proline porter II [Serratia odorifera]HEJ9094826.1 MFS transporter [Serratia odorifera]
MAAHTAVIDARRSRQALLAGSVGNFIEWYEFGVYGFLATVIAANFFTLQGESEITSLILTYAAFALAFFCRPIGAVIFGRIGDRIGRRPTLIAVLLLMTLATALIGVMPTYAAIGVAAPLLLTLLRMLQGLFAGGEFGGAVSLMTEFAPPGKRGQYGAWQSLTVALGLLAGAGLVALLAALLSKEQLYQWGWRIPFLLALPMGAVALWLRLKLEETPTFTQAQQSPQSDSAPAASLRGVLTTILLGIGRMMGWSAAGYTFLVVMPSYLQTSLHATFQQALVATVLANVGFALTILPAGILSDRWGRKTVMLTAMLAVILFTFPLLHLLQDVQTSLAIKGIAVLIAGAVVGLLAGPGPAMLAEMFPTRVRYTGLGLAYSLSNAVFSGSAGLIITGLIKQTGNIDIPAYYVVATSLVSLLALMTLRRDDHLRSLNER